MMMLAVVAVIFTALVLAGAAVGESVSSLG